MTPEEFFRKMASELPKLERQIAKDIIAVEAEQFHAKNFKDEGFTDTSLQKWPQRKKPDKRAARRALLVQTSTLKGHAIKGRVIGNQVQFSFPLEYMRVHNEGGRAGRGSGFQMPQRQFVGESEYLKNRIEAKAKKYLDHFFKNL